MPNLLVCGFAFSVLVACRSEPTTSSTTPQIQEDQTHQGPEIQTPLIVSPVASPVATEAVDQPPIESATATPASTIFTIDWDDREPFREGLVDSEQPVLMKLPGASTYHLRIQIDDSLMLIRGQEEVRYTNQEKVVLHEVYFHLFPNLLGGATDITDVRVDGRPVSPQYELGRSVMRVPLESPMQPGAQVVIRIEFSTTVPTENGPNYGVFTLSEDILALAHFYPMIAVFDDEGWNIRPPSPYGDVVYADSSFYLVNVVAPVDKTIVASGVELERETVGMTQAVTFAAGPMRDFYLAASQRYQVVSAEVGQTQINSYAPRELVEGARAALGFTSAALRSFSDRFGPYPFTELDVVTTPTLAGGVEYPGIFVNAIRAYEMSEESEAATMRNLLESTTAHETAHQWFYSVIGNDQLDEPWLDEALAQYATWLYYIDQYGDVEAQGFYQSWNTRWQRVEQAEIPIGLAVDAYEGVEYGAIVYGRGPIFVNALADFMGQEGFDRFIRDYYRTYQWEIVTTQGLKRLAEQHCRCDLTPLFEKWVSG
jgi:hypothetical protein